MHAKKKPDAWYSRIIELKAQGLNANQIATQLGDPKNTYKSVWGFLKRLEMHNVET